MESTLGHFGEDPLHDIQPFPLPQVGQNFRAVISEIVIEKSIHEENLADYVDQVEELTEDELGGKEIVFANGLSEVVHHCDPKGKY